MVRWDPEEYHRSSSAQLSWATELLGKLALRGDPGDERVLDVGCGDGKVTAEIARRLPEGSALGVDNSPEMIDFALQLRDEAGLENLDFRVADARELPFRDEFDVVFSNAALHWVVDHRPVLAGIARSLVGGGRALLQMGGRGNAGDVVEVVEAMVREARWAAYFDGFEFPYGFHGPEEYRAWLEEAGLRPLRVELFARDMTQDGAEGLAGWVRTTWMPYTHRLPEGMREEFLGEVVGRYAREHPADEDGRLHVRMVRLEAEALKPH